MTSYFAAVVDFVGAHPHYALAAVFLLALSEAIPVVGTVVPGSTLIIVISALATAADVNPWLLLAAALAGAISGDGLSFWLGQRYHREILLGWPLNRYPQFIERSEMFINRYGAASVFLARFIAVVRAFVPLVAGILRMSPRQFYAANILSALAWAPAHVFPGVLLGIAVSLAGVSAGQRTLLLVAGLIVISAAVWAMRFYLSRHPLPTKLPARSRRAPVHGLPKNWDSIEVGDLVIALENLNEGWWEAIVMATDKDMLTLKWRDYPTFPRFSLHRTAVALLKPTAADA